MRINKTTHSPKEKTPFRFPCYTVVLHSWLRDSNHRIVAGLEQTETVFNSDRTRYNGFGDPQKKQLHRDTQTKAREGQPKPSLRSELRVLASLILFFP